MALFGVEGFGVDVGVGVGDGSSAGLGFEVLGEAGFVGEDGLLGVVLLNGFVVKGVVFCKGWGLGSDKICC